MDDTFEEGLIAQLEEYEQLIQEFSSSLRSPGPDAPGLEWDGRGG